MKTLYPVSHLILTLALGGRHNIIITLITFNLILQCLLTDVREILSQKVSYCSGM